MGWGQALSGVGGAERHWEGDRAGVSCKDSMRRIERPSFIYQKKKRGESSEGQAGGMPILNCGSPPSFGNAATPVSHAAHLPAVTTSLVSSLLFPAWRRASFPRPHIRRRQCRGLGVRGREAAVALVGAGRLELGNEVCLGRGLGQPESSRGGQRSRFNPQRLTQHQEMTDENHREVL